MRRILLVLLILAVLPAFAVIAAEGDPVRFSLNQCFQSSLTDDQRSGLGEKASLESLAKILSPEQREQVRAKLKSAESTSQDPAVLKEVFRGYSLLEQTGEALRVADELVILEPRNPGSYVRKGTTLHGMGNYEGAAEEALKALKLNPKDEAAGALFGLSEGRRSVKMGQGSTGGSLASAVSKAVNEGTVQNDGASRPYKPIINAGSAEAPPEWKPEAAPENSRKFPWLPWCVGGTICGGVVGRSMWRGDKDRVRANVKTGLLAFGVGMSLPVGANLAQDRFLCQQTMTDVGAFGTNLAPMGRSRKKPCPRVLPRAKASTAPRPSMGGAPGQGSSTNPEEAKDVERCRQAIMEQARSECSRLETCLEKRAKELGYNECQLRPSFQAGGPGMLNTKAPGPGVQVAGSREDDECVDEEKDGGRAGGAVDRSESSKSDDEKETEAQKSASPERGLAPEGERPPGFDKKWRVGAASRPSEAVRGGKSYWDPRGGEWRFFPGDEYRYPHWDYNPHDIPNSPWQNIPLRPGGPTHK